MLIFVYPGSFDPVTNGHLDVIARTLKICDKLIVAVGTNESKKSTFTVEERMKFLKMSIDGQPNIEIVSYSGLLVDFIKSVGSKTVIKGLRALSDFEYEFQMALLNKSLYPEMETLFMMTNSDYSFLSSSSVREIAKFGGDIKGFVPECIREKIIKKIKD